MFSSCLLYYKDQVTTIFRSVTFFFATAMLCNHWGILWALLSLLVDVAWVSSTQVRRVTNSFCYFITIFGNTTTHVGQGKSMPFSSTTCLPRIPATRDVDSEHKQLAVRAIYARRTAFLGCTQQGFMVHSNNMGNYFKEKRRQKQELHYNKACFSQQVCCVASVLIAFCL